MLDLPGRPPEAACHDVLKVRPAMVCQLPSQKLECVLYRRARHAPDTQRPECSAELGPFCQPLGLHADCSFTAAAQHLLLSLAGACADEAGAPPEPGYMVLRPSTLYPKAW